MENTECLSTASTNTLEEERGVLCPSRIRLLLDLALKLNSTLMKAQDLNDIFQATLVGITAGDGLGFNRAFLALLNEENGLLEGRLAIGPADAEDAGRIWSDIFCKGLSLFEILEGVKKDFNGCSSPINRLVKNITIPFSDTNNILIRAMSERRAIKVNGGSDKAGALDIRGLLNSEEFAVVPIVTDEKMYGVIIADNFVTRAPITNDDIDALHLFATLASIAICKTSMCGRLEDWVCRLKKMNDEAERNKDLLIESERLSAIGKMADQLFHEIRNPLTTIGGMANILKKKLADPELGVYAETIVRNAQRLEQIIGSVFDCSHEPDLRAEKTLLDQIIRTSLALFNKEFNRLDVTVRYHNTDPSIELDLDQRLMRQAFLNIFKNAAEAMPDGGILVVSVMNQGGIIEIQITDTGLGIARGHLRHIDEPFFTTKTQGTGLSLCLAKRTIAAHGGSLCITSNRFRGATVTITLPGV